MQIIQYTELILRTWFEPLRTIQQRIFQDLIIIYGM